MLPQCVIKTGRFALSRSDCVTPPKPRRPYEPAPQCHAKPTARKDPAEPRAIPRHNAVANTAASVSDPLRGMRMFLIIANGLGLPPAVGDLGQSAAAAPRMNPYWCVSRLIRADTRSAKRRRAWGSLSSGKTARRRTRSSTLLTSQAPRPISTQPRIPAP